MMSLTIRGAGREDHGHDELAPHATRPSPRRRDRRGTAAGSTAPTRILDRQHPHVSSRRRQIEVTAGPGTAPEPSRHTAVRPCQQNLVRDAEFRIEGLPPGVHPTAPWLAVSELFGSVNELSDGHGGGFTNAGTETLFEALSRTAIDWDGMTTCPADGTACDLSAHVLADLGHFDSRDELFARHMTLRAVPARPWRSSAMGASEFHARRPLAGHRLRSRRHGRDGRRPERTSAPGRKTSITPRGRRRPAPGSASIDHVHATPRHDVMQVTPFGR